MPSKDSKPFCFFLGGEGHFSPARVKHLILFQKQVQAGFTSFIHNLRGLLTQWFPEEQTTNLSACRPKFYQKLFLWIALAADQYITQWVGGGGGLSFLTLRGWNLPCPCPLGLWTFCIFKGEGDYYKENLQLSHVIICGTVTFLSLSFPTLL